MQALIILVQTFELLLLQDTWLLFLDHVELVSKFWWIQKAICKFMQICYLFAQLLLLCLIHRGHPHELVINLVIVFLIVFRLILSTDLLYFFAYQNSQLGLKLLALFGTDGLMLQLYFRVNVISHAFESLSSESLLDCLVVFHFYNLNKLLEPSLFSQPQKRENDMPKLVYSRCFKFTEKKGNRQKNIAQICSLQYSLEFQMRKQEQLEMHSLLLNKQHNKSKISKDSILKHKDFQTLCLGENQLKHAHAIRPYCSKQRKSSTRRDSKCNQSPHKLSRSKSKRFDSSSKKADEMTINVGGKQLGQMYAELINLKSQYKMLKANNNKISFQNNQLKRRLEECDAKKEEELQVANKELIRQKKNKALLEQQLDRIKKQCCRIVELERFKVKKFEETLQQKELMIAYLRNQIQKMKKGTHQSQTNKSSLFLVQNSIPLFDFDYLNRQTQNIQMFGHANDMQNKRNKSSVLQQDSLSFSRDKSKEADSIIQSFLSHDQSQIQYNFGKKQTIMINSLQQSPIETNKVELLQEISQKSQQQSKNHEQPKNMKQMIERQSETIPVLGKSKSKLNSKKLQITIVDQNIDTNNITEQVQMETKKKSLAINSGFRNKKKMTAKKSKQI